MKWEMPMLHEKAGYKIVCTTMYKIKYVFICKAWAQVKIFGKDDYIIVSFPFPNFS